MGNGKSKGEASQAVAEGASTTKKVVAIGMLGVGKSTLLNCAVDMKNDKPFLVLNSAEGVT